MGDHRQLPENLRIARRSLEGIHTVSILDDWVWNENIYSWMLHCRLTAPDYTEHPFLPRMTDWYVAASSEYPLGSISFFPSKNNGISCTFQHQLNNSKAEDALPWRWGSICLDLNVKVLGRLFAESEPFSVENRLVWYFYRALNWLKAASRGDFTKPGEPFELPDFATKKENVLAFSESASSFALWMESNEKVGIVKFVKIKNTNTHVVTSFENRMGRHILSLDWGNVMSRQENEYDKGLWIRLSQMPVLEPWQPPSTLGELIDALKEQDIDFYETIKSVTSEIRDGARHFLLLGFPIPSKYGEESIRLHWQAILLPQLSSGSKTMDGFRPNETGRFLRDKTKIIYRDLKLDWISSENWNKEQVSRRGKFPDSLSMKRVLIIGCGAVGSLIAEMLVRGNVNHLVLMDGEQLEVGNLVRHTLELSDIRKSKAQQLAWRLNSINPNAKINAIVGDFPPTAKDEIEVIRRCDLILDCTGDDEVLLSLPQFSWGGEKLMTSINLNYGASKAFIFTYRGESFPVQQYLHKIRPHLEKIDQVDELPSDGIGCWHPTFPARADDVWLLMAACVKYVLNSVEKPFSAETCRFAVFEQVLENGDFVGIRKTE